MVLATASTTAANNLLLTAWEALIKRFFKINGGGIVSCTGAPTFDLIGETNEIMVAFTDFQAKYKITTEMKK